MEFFKLSSNALVSIMIPMNFMIGEYTLFCKIKHMKRRFIHCGVLISVLLLWLFLSINKIHPYYSFVLIGSSLVGIIQSEIDYKSISDEERLSLVERYFKKIRMILGMIVVLLPHIPIFYIYFLQGTPLLVIYLSYLIYFMLGIEMITLNWILSI